MPTNAALWRSARIRKDHSRYKPAYTLLNQRRSGGIRLTQTGCADPSKNGTFDDFATITITQNATNLGLALTTTTTGLSCTFQGTLTQAGHFGAASGTFVCNGKTTPGNLFNMVVGPDSLVTHFSSSDPTNGCNSGGAVSVVRQM